MKRDEWDEWADYYHRIGQFERWSSLKDHANDMKGSVRLKIWSASRNISDVELKHLEEVLHEAERLYELVHRNAETYCAEKPSKPQGRNYYAR